MHLKKFLVAADDRTVQLHRWPQKLSCKTCEQGRKRKKKVSKVSNRNILNNCFSILFFLSPEGLPFENRVQLLTDNPGKKDTTFDTWLTIPLEKGVKRGELCMSVQAPWAGETPCLMSRTQIQCVRSWLKITAWGGLVAPLLHPRGLALLSAHGHPAGWRGNVLASLLLNK